jgi:hypothetical protein
MRDLSAGAKPARKRRQMPKWLVCRWYYEGPKRECSCKIVGFWRARDRDEAIEKAAYAIKCLAVLQAFRMGDTD